MKKPDETALDDGTKTEEQKVSCVFRRFVPIGTKEEMDRFFSLVGEKNLSREDLALILQAIRLNPDISW